MESTVTGHEQSWVKVNAKVDREMVGIITSLSHIEGLETLQSCQESIDGDAYIYFWCGTWDKVCRLVFGELLPALRNAGIEATGAVEVFNNSMPTAKIGFSARVLNQATLALESFVATALS